MRNGACPLACAYCGLYRSADDRPATGPEIARQVRRVRESFPQARGLKLYNASSLFEPASIAQRELHHLAPELAGLELVVVEARSENALGALAFSDRPDVPLEVAIGLDVADDGLLRRLNKPTSVAAFRAAAARLREAGIHLRVFVLIQPPFVGEGEAVALSCRTFEAARAAGARVVSLLPVIASHRPLDRLADAGFYAPPSLETVYDVAARCAGGDVIVRVELESLGLLDACAECSVERREALAILDRGERLPGVTCRAHRRPTPFEPRAYGEGAVLAALR